ncbi:DNA (cytosine-5)-methyltransferase CMT3 [Elaeis guineensis]|uniref:DNA (cytosine-5-)-methyltransferase n=1 Tax=Elaeis guineensis var. tenera TaxID=51953 RepID=B4XTS9_ELAGV|nr:CMT-type DNA-methyltransferase [Elaeis guineensis]
MRTAAAEKRVRRIKRAAEQGAEHTAPAKASISKRKRAPSSSSAAAAVGSSSDKPLLLDDREAVEEQAEQVGRSRSAQKKPILALGNDETVGVDEGEEDAGGKQSLLPQKRAAPAKKSKKKGNEKEVEHCFVGEPVPDDEAKKRWPERYQRKNAGKRALASASSKKSDEEEVLKARRHYWQAMVDNVIYNLNDDAYIKAGDGEPDYIGRIVEFFETTDGQLYFAAQWFFRAEDTVIKEIAHDPKTVHDPRRVFLSEEKNDNVLDCIVSKIRIVRVESNIDLKAKEDSIPPCDLYYDMSYSLSYSTFGNLPPESLRAGSETSSTISSEDASNVCKGKCQSDSEASSSGEKRVLSLLDLYSGCGAMSTGLCLGANLSGLKLETRWAVDINPYACESLKLNHPHTEVRNEKAEDFLALLREWEKLCAKFNLIGMESSFAQGSESSGSDDEDESRISTEVPRGEFEVGKLVGICYGDPSNIGKVGLKFKVRWKGYGPSEDTWEPIDGLSKCQERIKDFVQNGYKKNILPLPGKVDVICGGPPCQGISGFNRFRNYNAPLEDPKNQQMVVFMDIVDFLKPKYVLMENVVDILKFAHGFLLRYALSRLVAMNYQARLGMMVAGCYGLPQFRMRVFLWGACPTEILPQFPLPTHDVVVRGGAPNEFEQNIVAYDENQHRQLERALLLEDAISDLPQVGNNEMRDEMPYGRPPRTEFQHFIRLTREELVNSASGAGRLSQKAILFDHRPLQLNEDDYLRVCRIPKKKGANFRDLPGVKVGPDNVVEWDPEIERVLLPSGKPLVPDYAMSFIKGKSLKPFGRLWWDETVPTVVTRAEPHNQALLHPEQDRVLSIRENARLQGFPDFYRLRGPVKERYIQVGNAVAVPVARALGYSMGLAFQGKCSEQPVFTLPQKFPCLDQSSSERRVEADEVVE